MPTSQQLSLSLPLHFVACAKTTQPLSNPGAAPAPVTHSLQVIHATEQSLPELARTTKRTGHRTVPPSLLQQPDANKKTDFCISLAQPPAPKPAG